MTIVPAKQDKIFLIDMSEGEFDHGRSVTIMGRRDVPLSVFKSRTAMESLENLVRQMLSNGVGDSPFMFWLGAEGEDFTLLWTANDLIKAAGKGVL
jgi:hypothetical protein